MNSSLKTKGGELLRTLFENIMSFVLEALNLTFHTFAQLEIFIKSLFNISAVSFGSFPIARSEQSSAKRRISLSISLTISLIKILRPSRRVAH